MARTLEVYLHGELVGHLVQDDGGRMVFGYTENWLQRPGAAPVSQSLPLRKEKFTARECRAFFAGILPGESQREIIARNLGISARNDYAMLERIGGECAGAITFIPPGGAPPEHSFSYRKLSEQDLAGILRELPRRPLLAGEEGIRLSLAGAQDKVAVRIEDGEVSVPLGGAPSTHILKPAVGRFDGVVFNEALCMKLASAAGLRVADVETGTADGIDFLRVKRYDRHHRRVPGAETILERLHQEDFCQAMGIVPEHKYQQEGGPSLKQCFALLRSVSSAPVLDLARLLDAVIFNALVGNNDAHGKNFSLLYTPQEGGSQATALSPLYDIVSTVCYPELSPAMAMKIGRQNSSVPIMPADFEQLAQEAELGKAQVRRRVPELAATVSAALANVAIAHPTAEKVAAIIRQRCDNALARFRN